MMILPTTLLPEISDNIFAVFDLKMVKLAVKSAKLLIVVVVLHVQPVKHCTASLQVRFSTVYIRH